MRMHTIPQNVTAYEDRIVGMLVGRQFIYLAVAGIAIFILLSTQIGPLPIRLFASIIIGAFAAAMALLKINDRGFDSLVLSYLRAMFGPTEWIWKKDQLPIEKLSVLTLQGTTPSKQDESPKNKQNDRLQRVSRYQRFIS